MLVSRHFLLGLIFAGFLYLIFPEIKLIGFSIIFLSSFLIDVDHYLYYLFMKKDWNLKNAYKWFIEKRKKFFSLPRKERNSSKTTPFLFHGVEILLILFLLGIFVSKIFIFILVGFAFHFLLDLIEQPLFLDRISKFSLIRDFYRR